ncbi:7140_t:CDS:1, partial [Cetraspora pellucida]
AGNGLLGGTLLLFGVEPPLLPVGIICYFWLGYKPLLIHFRLWRFGDPSPLPLGFDRLFVNV